MNGFSFNTVQRIVAEPHCTQQLGDYAVALGMQHVLLVTDKGIMQLGLAQAAIHSLQAAGVRVTVYDDVIPDPPETVLLNAVQQAKEIKIDSVIGFGGGSSLDVAKLIALLANPEQTQSIEEIYGVDQIKGKRLPLIQVPTTAGTGSEVTAVAIISTGENTKMGVVSPVLYADVAMLDASLTLGLPASITAVTGIDAMVHAIEAYTSKHLKNPYSDMLAIQALKLLDANFAAVMQDGSNMVVRHNMLLGSCLAGQAFANAPVAAVHALAYPLGGFYHLSHGLTNALVLPAVFKFNLPVAQAQYAQIFSELDPKAAAPLSTVECANALSSRLAAHIRTGQFKTRLRDYDIPHSDLSKLAASAMLQTRLLKNNPREVTQADAQRIYEEIY